MMFQPFDSLFNHLFESIRVTDPLLYQTGQQIKPWTLPTNPPNFSKNLRSWGRDV